MDSKIREGILTIEKAHQQFSESISRIYGLREALSIARIVFEDEFKIYNFARQDHLALAQIRHLGTIERRLLDHEPVQYILRMADFYGLKFKVNPDVLIPRQETEELVYWVLENAKFYPHPLRILDIGTGSGCIPITIKKEQPQHEVEGLDISEKALTLARSNAKLNDTEVNFYQFDILDETAWPQAAQYDLIASNPPYITRQEEHLMPMHVKAFEPHLALFVENDSALLFYRKIVAFAQQKLRSGGRLFFETNEFNATEVRDLMQTAGFVNVELRQDLNGKYRMVGGIWQAKEDQ